LQKYKSELGSSVSEERQGHTADEALLARAHSYLTSKTARSVSSQDVLQVESARQYQLKENMLSTVHSTMLLRLDQLLGSKYRVFVHMQLNQFILAKVETKTISFLVSKANEFVPLLGIDFEGEDAALLKVVFSSIDKPLLIVNPAEKQAEAQLESFLCAHLELKDTRVCVKCGSEMRKRRARGKNAGQQFWVCRRYPDCKGLSQIGEVEAP